MGVCIAVSAIEFAIVLIGSQCSISIVGYNAESSWCGLKVDKSLQSAPRTDMKIIIASVIIGQYISTGRSAA